MSDQGAAGATSLPARLFLWPGQALYIGHGRESTLHRHLALQIGLSLGQPINVRTSEHEPFQPVAGFMAQPHAIHQVDAANIPAVFLWTELLPPPRPASVRAEGGGLVQLEPTQLIPLLQVIRAIQVPALSCAEARNLFTHCLSALVPARADHPSLDSRIIALMQLIEGDFHEAQSRPIALLARNLHLSPSRLRHLFTAQTGMNLQRYLLWQRLLRALRESIDAPSLTAAAHAAGFADLAHLTRVFRATFGLTPSEIFRNSRSVQAIPCLP